MTCKKKLTYDAGKLTAYSHQSPEKWALFIEVTLSMKTLDQCAEDISVSHVTSFNLRQKLLAFLEELAKQGNLLDDMIEADETYIRVSHKGIRIATRKPRNHGEPAAKSGLSNELMCICVVADRDGNVIAQCVNRVKLSSNNIEDAIGSRIAEVCVFQCDGATAYNKLVEAKHCTKVVLSSHSDYNKVYHLNTVNCLHSRLKEMMKHFNGVPTK